jgi:hypothetical protein
MTDNLSIHIAISSSKPHQARLKAYVEHLLETGDNVSAWARNAMIEAIPSDWTPNATGKIHLPPTYSQVTVLSKDDMLDELKYEEID